MKTYNYEQLARDLLDVKSKSGDELICLCPFHGDSTPSLWFNVVKGVFVCYACNEGGGIKKFLRLMGKQEDAPEKVTDEDAYLNGVLDDIKKIWDDMAAKDHARGCRCHAIWSEQATLTFSSLPPADLTSTSALGYNLVLTGRANRSSSGTQSGRCERCSKPFILKESTLSRYSSSGSLRSYLEGRGITTKKEGLPSTSSTRAREISTQELFDLRWDAVSRSVVMPYRTEKGSLLGVVHRRLKGTPKYNYPRKFPRTETLFGSWLLYKNLPELPRLRRDVLPDGWVVLCEGPFDVMKVWQSGLPAVGMWGSMLHDKHVQLLTKLGVRGVVLFTDRDSAGRLASRTAARKLLSTNSFGVKVVRYPKSYPASMSDPGSLSEVLIRSRVKKAREVYPWDMQ